MNMATNDYRLRSRSELPRRSVRDEGILEAVRATLAAHGVPESRSEAHEGCILTRDGERGIFVQYYEPDASRAAAASKQVELLKSCHALVEQDYAVTLFMSRRMFTLHVCSDASAQGPGRPLN